MDYCFSSICPNDLINNVEETRQNNQSTNHVTNYQQINPEETNCFSLNNNNFFADEAYVTGSSSCSPSSVSSSSASSVSSAGSPLFDQLKPTQSGNNLETIEFASPCLLTAGFNKIDEISFQPQSEQPIDYILNNFSNNQPQIHKLNEITKLSPGVFHIQQKSPTVIKPILVSPQPILIVDPSTSNAKPSGKHSIDCSENEPSGKKANILPPSPPSSFVSDSESNHSSSSSASNITSAPTPKIIKASNKINKSNIKGSNTLIKQIRQQSSIVNISTKSISTKSAAKTAKISASCNSDDDCWPFLCSLNVIFKLA